MRVIHVPYHIDEYLPELDLPLHTADVVTAGLSAGEVWGRLAALYSAVADAVADAVRRGTRPAVVSGDCTTALGTMAGLQRAGVSPGVVWLDAHGDVQTLETTTSGYLGGMPLRLLVGYRPELIASRLGLRPVPEQHVTLAGARDLDPPEVTYLAASQIRRSDVANLDVTALADRPLYVHLDLDLADPADLPGLRYPAPGGPGPAQLAAALRQLLRSGRVSAVGVACTWHPGSGSAARISHHLHEAFAAEGF